MRITSIVSFIAIMLFANLFIIAQKNFETEADAKFMNEAYFTAIDLYKRAETKEKNPAVKARLNFQIAECYRFMIEPEQSETYYTRAIMLKHNIDYPEVYLLIADVIKEQGNRYKEAAEFYSKYLKVNPDSKQAKENLTKLKWKISKSNVNFIKIIEENSNQLVKDIFQLSGDQAKAILELRLHRLTSIEQDDIKKNLENIVHEIQNYLDVLIIL